MSKSILSAILVCGAIFWQACSGGSHIRSAPGGRDIQAASPGGRATTVLDKYIQDSVLTRPELAGGQVGIAVYDPSKASFLEAYQATKYFVPASNTKLFSLYAGLKYLGDSLVGMRYLVTDTALLVLPSGDPSFLHPDYPVQPVMDLMRKTGKKIWLVDDNWQEAALGRGWAWDDYNDDYCPERSAFPIYADLIRWVQERPKGSANDPFGGSPSIYSIPEVDWPVKFNPDTAKKNFFVHRDRDRNVFEVTEGREEHKSQDVPFITDGLDAAALLLKDTAGAVAGVRHFGSRLPAGWQVVHSRPVDSLFRPMMYNSDNFFAEQTLLMVGNETLGAMNDAHTINSLLHGPLDSLPQRPQWVDGSGLSRYDLFTPADFVWLLDKMQREFGLARMERLLPTGGTGTLSAYYRQDSSFIFAKTGSLSGVIALSGYVYTRRNRLLIFSVLVNNYMGSGSAVRRQIERLIHRVRDIY
ncbi:MAG TPA: D-alanyl-D-alanine carboxypeptidase [Puia sp.]|nr:D-alanyl-D-alanine carboxypeptidase [Puia sp.]